MKTIFRTFNLGLILASILALGAVVTFAQDPAPAKDPCTDVDGQNALYDKFLAAFAVKTLDGRKQWVDLGKQYVEKYGNCTTNDTVKTNSAYFNAQIPKWEKAIVDMGLAQKKKAMIDRFNAALTGKNWDELYASGKDLMANYPDEFRDIELALGTVGFDENFNKNNPKYNDETIRFAKQSISDLEGGKTFSANFGVPNDFVYKSKANAIGWMNMIVGYLTQSYKKDKAGARPYLYKAATAGVDTVKNPLPYEFIGYYYFDELDKIGEEIKALNAQQDKPGITEDELKKLVEDIKAKVGVSNGLAERAMDAFQRANTLATAPAYKAKMKANVDAAYKRRFGKTDGVDAFVATLVAKPFADPSTPVTPINDPEPVKTDATTSGVATTTTTGGATTVPTSTTTNGTAKPATQPATKPASTMTTPVKKPRAAVTTKKTTKKKTA